MINCALSERHRRPFFIFHFGRLVLFVLIFKYLGTCQVGYLTPGAHETGSKLVL